MSDDDDELTYDSHGDDDHLSVEAIKSHTEVVDITDDPAWMAAARWEVAAFAPYRVSIDQMQRLVESQPERFRLVIAPGRYCPVAS